MKNRLVRINVLPPCQPLRLVQLGRYVAGEKFCLDMFKAAGLVVVDDCHLAACGCCSDFPGVGQEGRQAFSCIFYLVGFGFVHVDNSQTLFKKYDFNF